MPELTDRDRDVLNFEHGRWNYAGAKETAVREGLGMTAGRYYQLLNGLIDRPEALLFDPVLVQRLRRLRDVRRLSRSGVRFAGA